MKLISLKLNTVAKNSSQFKRTQGFSLLELIIVLLIVAILGAIAVPQISSSLQVNRVNTLNAACAGKLSEARMQAIKRNTSVSLIVNMQNRRMWLESGGVMIGSSESYQPELQLEFSPSKSTTQEVVTFNSFGNLQTTPVTITQNNSNIRLKKSLQVSISGKITVQPSIRY